MANESATIEQAIVEVEESTRRKGAIDPMQGIRFGNEPRTEPGATQEQPPPEPPVAEPPVNEGLAGLETQTTPQTAGTSAQDGTTAVEAGVAPEKKEPEAPAPPVTEDENQRILRERHAVSEKQKERERQLAEREAQIAAKEAKVNEEGAIIAKAYGDEFLQAYMALKAVGKSSQDALSGASAATGLQLQTAQSGPPKEGTDEYNLLWPHEVGLDPAKDLARWQEHMDRRTKLQAKIATKDEIVAVENRLRAEFEAQRETERKAESDRKAAEAARASAEGYRKSLLRTADAELLYQKGIATSTMQQPQMQHVLNALVDTGKAVGVYLDDLDWLAKNPISSEKMREIVSLTPLDPKTFPVGAPVAGASQIAQPSKAQTPPAVEESAKVQHRPILAGARSDENANITGEMPVQAPKTPAEMTQAWTESLRWG